MTLASIAVLYAAFSRSRSATGTVSGNLLTGAKNGLSSAFATTMPSSCASTFSMIGRGCTTPFATPSRMFTIAWSMNTTKPSRRLSQFS